MIIASGSGLGRHFGARTLFSQVSFDIQEGERIGLVGVNGCGKTTLLRMLTGEEKPDEGEIHKSRLLRLGYMQQHVSHDSPRTVYEEALEVFAPLMVLEEEIASVTTRLAGGPSGEEMERLVRRQSSLQEQYESAGGYTYKSRTRAALLGLGFTEKMLAMPVNLLSGGEKAKVLLARVLLKEADLLLLDEPTNHLDIASVEWLENFLAEYRGAVVVISHDRYFLDVVANRIFELENGKLTAYGGNYTAYLKKKETDREIARRHHDNTMREIHRIEGIVAQQRQWNRERNIRTAESKLKQIARLEKTLEQVEEGPEGIRFRFAPKEVSGNDVIETRELGKSFEHKPLFRGLSMLVRRGERVFLLGANGCGKTTLLKIIMGLIPPDEGRAMLGVNVYSGYYDQTQAQLNYTKTVFDEIHDAYPLLSGTQVRNALAAFLFQGDDVFKCIADLSGGERARVSLLKLMLCGANLLLLDEPTNHLDISSREALEQALMDYEGTMLIVSHDRYFINKMANRVLLMSENGLENFDGNYDYYLYRIKERAKAPQTAKAQAAPPNEYQQRKEKRKEKRRLLGALERAEKAASQAEKKVKELEELLCSPEVSTDYEKALEVGAQLEQARLEADQAAEEWLELSELAEEDEEE
jgi:ATP-binding cassette subfamily F protein 3